jgi:hypothetical protein
LAPVAVRITINTPRENICDMDGPLGASLAAKPAIDLRHATGVAQHNGIGFARHDRLNLVVEHCAAHIGHLYGEQAAESAALISAG